MAWVHGMGSGDGMFDVRRGGDGWMGWWGSGRGRSSNRSGEEASKPASRSFQVGTYQQQQPGRDMTVLCTTVVWIWMPPLTSPHITSHLTSHLSHLTLSSLCVYQSCTLAGRALISACCCCCCCCCCSLRRPAGCECSICQGGRSHASEAAVLWPCSAALAMVALAAASSLAARFSPELLTSHGAEIFRSGENPRMETVVQSSCPLMT
jgi:hypothetical protein